MASSRRTLLICLAGLLTSLLSLPASHGNHPFRLGTRQEATDDRLLRHPALAEPDGVSHRGDRMVAANISDARIVAELSRRFRATRPTLAGQGEFERRQEYLLRLLDYYYFSGHRLTGKTRAEVEQIFGAGTPASGIPQALEWSGGRDTFVVYLRGDRVTGCFYAMGY